MMMMMNTMSKTTFSKGYQPTLETLYNSQFTSLTEDEGGGELGFSVLRFWLFLDRFLRQKNFGFSVLVFIVV